MPKYNIANVFLLLCHSRTFWEASPSIFGVPSECVPSGEKLSQASANMCQVEHNFQRHLTVNLCQIVHIFIALCEYVFSLRQCMTNSCSQLNSIANLGFQN